jgi:hypothetical protein
MIRVTCRSSIVTGIVGWLGSCLDLRFARIVIEAVTILEAIATAQSVTRLQASDRKEGSSYAMLSRIDADSAETGSLSSSVTLTDANCNRRGNLDCRILCGLLQDREVNPRLRQCEDILR